MLLDFACPGAERSTENVTTTADADDPAQAQTFLAAVARRALEGPAASNHLHGGDRIRSVAPPPPLASLFLSGLARGAFNDIDYVVGNLRHLVSLPASITRPWRAASLSLAPFLAMVITLIILVAVRFDTKREQARLAELFAGQPAIPALLDRYIQLATEIESGASEPGTVRILLASRLHAWLEAGHHWTDAEVRAALGEERMTVARQTVEAHAAPTAEELAAAEKALPRILVDQEAAAQRERRKMALEVVFVVWAGVFGLWGLTELGGCLLAACEPHAAPVWAGPGGRARTQGIPHASTGTLAPGVDSDLHHLPERLVASCPRGIGS